MELIAPHRPAQTRGEIALEEFTSHLESSRFSVATARSYRAHAERFVRWVGQRDLDNPETMVRAWKHHLAEERALKPATVGPMLSAVTLFCRVVLGSAVTARPAMTGGRPAPRPLTPAETAAVMRVADRRGPRDAAIIATLLGSGARVEECARLVVDDVPPTRTGGRVRLTDGRGRRRDVPVDHWIAVRLAAWLAERDRWVCPDSDGGELWRGRRGPLTVDGLTAVVLEVGARAGVDGLRPGRLRDTFADRKLRAGVGTERLAQLLDRRRRTGPSGPGTRRSPGAAGTRTT